MKHYWRMDYVDLLPYWFCQKHRIDIPEDQISGESHAGSGIIIEGILMAPIDIRSV